MDESLWVDLDAMRAASAGLDHTAVEVSRMVAELKADLAREGEFWGNDEPGKMIAESYVPGAERAMEGMENLLADVGTLASELASAAGTFEHQDLGAAQHISIANPTTVTAHPDEPDPGGYQSPVSPSNVERTSQPLPQAAGSAPIANLGGATDRPDADATAAQNNSGQSPSARSPSAQSSDPQWDSLGGTGGLDHGAGGNRETDGSQAPAEDTPVPHSANAAAAAANPIATSAPRANPISAKESGPAARTAGTPWSGNPANTPWSKSPAASSPTTSPSNGAPPRVSPPRTGSRPGTVQDAAEKDKKKRTAPQRPVPQRAETDNEAMRIASEMAARHNLEIRGFEASGIREHTVREMAAALDAVLVRYAVALCGIEITDLAGAPSRVENRSTETGSDDPAPWIVLDRVATANPSPLVGPTVTGSCSGDAGQLERPMYAMIVRALGGVLDIAGGFRARAEAQRTLITEYLRVRGAKGDTLARVVSGYKQWRSALGDNCFRNGVFAPAAALAEAFAAVELDGEMASGPAETLHRLLVMMAKASTADPR